MRVCRQRIASILGSLVLLVLVASGCASPQRVYTPQNCPPELYAPPVTNSQVLDLSRFAGPPISSDRINGGDVLEVSIAAGLESDDVTTFPVRMTDAGIASLPEIGELALAGLELGGAEKAIAAACLHRQLYRNPHVTVTMKKPRLNRVTVVGAVENPGVYELPYGSSYLLDAIVAAGGFADDAGTNVDLRRPQLQGGLMASSGSEAGLEAGSSETGVQLAGAVMARPGVATGFTRVDLVAMVRRGGTDEYLPDSSTVMIERRQPHPIEVIGLVKKPGQYELPPNQELRLLGAIALTGGLSNALADNVLVIRTDPRNGEAALIKTSIQNAKRNRVENIRLAPGDVITVERTAATLFMDTLNFVRINVGGNIPLF